VKNGQDYEIKDQRNYRFTVRVEGEPLDVALSVDNVDDSAPYFSAPDSTMCEVSVSNLRCQQAALHTDGLTVYRTH
jgi:hypothetical protein